MAKYDLSQKAAEDLFSIWKYTLDNWSATQADNYYSTLEEAFSEIAVHPLKFGKSVDEIYPGLYSYHIKRHIIFYLLQENGRVLIVRILLEKMDYRKHL